MAIPAIAVALGAAGAAVALLLSDGAGRSGPSAPAHPERGAHAARDVPEDAPPEAVEVHGALDGVDPAAIAGLAGRAAARAAAAPAAPADPTVIDVLGRFRDEGSRDTPGLREGLFQALRRDPARARDLAALFADLPPDRELLFAVAKALAPFAAGEARAHLMAALAHGSDAHREAVFTALAGDTAEPLIGFARSAFVSDGAPAVREAAGFALAEAMPSLDREERSRLKLAARLALRDSRHSTREAGVRVEALRILAAAAPDLTSRDLEEARLALFAAAETEPAKLWALYAIARRLRLRDTEEDTVGIIRSAAEDPDQPPSVRELARAAIGDGDPAALLDQVERALLRP